MEGVVSRSYNRWPHRPEEKTLSKSGFPSAIIFHLHFHHLGKIIGGCGKRRIEKGDKVTVARVGRSLVQCNLVFKDNVFDYKEIVGNKGLTWSC